MGPHGKTHPAGAKYKALRCVSDYYFSLGERQVATENRQATGVWVNVSAQSSLLLHVQYRICFYFERVIR